MIPIKFNAPWHPLRHVIVGRCYDVDFFTPIKNPRIRDSLQKISSETEEDYQSLIKILTKHDIKVERPQLDPNLTIMDFVSDRGTIDFDKARSATLIPRPPMQPRDCVLIADQRLIAANDEIRWFLDCVRESDIIPNIQSFDAPMINVVGDTLIVDAKDDPRLPGIVQNLLPDYKIRVAHIGGHNDAVFCLPKPGLILSTHHHSNYSSTLPGWEVEFIANQSWQAIPQWRTIKHSNRTKWWVPDSLDNPQFAEFINAWLTDWVGYVHETVFDINMLQIDSTTILVNNYNADLFSILKKHGIDAEVVPFRHRFFWDGGLHCVTSDLYRDGDKETYV